MVSIKTNLIEILSPTALAPLTKAPKGQTTLQSIQVNKTLLLYFIFYISWRKLSCNASKKAYHTETTRIPLPFTLYYTEKLYFLSRLPTLFQGKCLKMSSNIKRKQNKDLINSKRHGLIDHSVIICKCTQPPYTLSHSFWKNAVSVIRLKYTLFVHLSGELQSLECGGS